jgi:hypothetical protein
MSAIESNLEVPGWLPNDLDRALTGSVLVQSRDRREPRAQFYRLEFRPCEQQIWLTPVAEEDRPTGRPTCLCFDVHKGCRTIFVSARVTRYVNDVVRNLVPVAYGHALRLELMRRGALGRDLQRYAPRPPDDDEVTRTLGALRTMLDAVMLRGDRE